MAVNAQGKAIGMFDPAQAAQYREWALGVADKVAMASTEGGFLGFGGTRLSDPEKALIEQIKTAVQSKRLTGIADVKDLTDLANGTRLVIEVKNGINPEALLEQLFKATKLEDTFAINAVALVEGQPRTLSLKEMLEVYLAHRIEVTLRRSTFLLNKAEERLHLVRGLITAIADIDDVIAIIRGSDDVPQARTKLMDAFDLDEVRAGRLSPVFFGSALTNFGVAGAAVAEAAGAARAGFFCRLFDARGHAQAISQCSPVASSRARVCTFARSEPAPGSE